MGLWAGLKWNGAGRGGPAPHLVNAYKDLDVILFTQNAFVNECNVLSSFQLKCTLVCSKLNFFKFEFII